MAKKPTKAPKAAAPKIERIEIENREQWLGLRKQDVTASAAAALLGVHPFETAFGLYQEKTGSRADIEENDAMRRGRYLEPVAEQVLREEHPELRFEKPNAYFRDVDRRIGTTPDLFAYRADGSKGAIQIKSVAPAVFRSRWLTDDDNRVVTPPEYVMVQGILDAYYSGCTWAAVAPIVVDWGLECPLLGIPLHAGILENVQGAVADFWKAVADGTPPEFDYEKDGERIAALYGASKAETIDLSKDNRIVSVLEEIEAAKAVIKEQEAIVKTGKNEVLAKMGAAEVAYVGPDWGLTFKTQDRAAYTTKATSFRVMRATRRKG